MSVRRDRNRKKRNPLHLAGTSYNQGAKKQTTKPPLLKATIESISIAMKISPLPLPL